MISRTKRVCIYVGAFILLFALGACNNNSKPTKDKTANEETEKNKDTGEQSSKDGVEDKVVLQIENEKVKLSEVMAYVFYLKNMYEPDFTNRIWNYQVEPGKNLSQMAKEEVINQIIEIKVMIEQAKKQSIEVTDDEILEIEKKAQDFYSMLTKDQMEPYGITYETILDICKDNYLAEKVFDVVTMSVDSNIPDEEAKQVKIWQIHVATNAVDDKGNPITLSENEKKGAYNKAKKLLKEARKQEDFYAFAANTSDDAQIEYTIGQADREEAFIEQVFSLKKGEISKLIKTEKGYYIVYCVNPFDEDATAQKKEEIISQRQDEKFRSLYAQWLKEYKIKINEDNLKEISFS